MKTKTKSSYVATYYVINGATIDKVVKIRLPYKTGKRRGYGKQWYFHLSGVRPELIAAVESGTARCRIRSMEAVRRRIKKEVVR